MKKLKKLQLNDHNMDNELPIKNFYLLIWAENKRKNLLNKLNPWVSIFRVNR